MIQFQAIEVKVPSLGTQPPWAHMPKKLSVETEAGFCWEAGGGRNTAF